MRVLTLALLDEPGKLYYNLVFDPDNRQFTNQALGRIFDSFGIATQDRLEWIDKVGAAKVVHEEYKGRMQAKIKYFLTQERQEELGFIQAFPFEDNEEIPA